MEYRVKQCIFIIIIMSLIISLVYAEKQDIGDKSVHRFEIKYKVDHTSIKNQYRTGTCWSFATISFLESEMIRTGRGEHDLSEMYPVRFAYTDKAIRYIRRHGKSNFSDGGQAHDVIEQIRLHGIVPEEAYTGLMPGKDKHDHSEMHTIIKAMLEALLNRNRGEISTKWKEAFEAVLDVYLGEPPSSFNYKGKSYTPQSFFDEVVGLNLDDYIEFTSYTHFPFYEQVTLDIPDNWMYYKYYNVPVDDLEVIIDYSIKNGFSVVWDGDVSEDGFSSRKTGYAVVPEKEASEMTEEEREALKGKPEKEKKINQEMRQETFNNWQTTDDHLMNIVGIAENQEGTKFYYTKNSHGIKDRKNNGYVYMSRSYARLKTIVIMVHKKGVPPEIASKIGL